MMAADGCWDGGRAEGIGEVWLNGSGEGRPHPLPLLVSCRLVLVALGPIVPLLHVIVKNGHNGPQLQVPYVPRL